MPDEPAKLRDNYGWLEVTLAVLIFAWVLLDLVLGRVQVPSYRRDSVYLQFDQDWWPAVVGVGIKLTAGVALLAWQWWLVRRRDSSRIGRLTVPLWIMAVGWASLSLLAIMHRAE